MNLMFYVISYAQGREIQVTLELNWLILSRHKPTPVKTAQNYEDLIIKTRQKLKMNRPF